MIVSVDNKDKGDLFDADGQQIVQCICADLESGECQVYTMPLTGSTTTVMHKPPLKFDRRKRGE